MNKTQENWRQTGHQRRSWWHSPLVGYPLAAVFVAGAFMIPWSARSMGIEDYFIEPPFVIAILLVGWLWGIGPAFLALILQVLALDYWIVPPLGDISFFRWPYIASFAPFVLMQLLVLSIVIAQRNYRQKLLEANQSISQYAEELAASNAQLEEADRAKDQFLSMTSHELRTPVTSIHGYIQLLQRRQKKQGKHNSDGLSVDDALNKMDEQARRLTRLVEDLLDINALRLGKMPMHPSPCNFCALCHKIVDEQSTLTGRQIEMNLAAPSLVLQLDEARISQVTLNLVSNALKYSPASTVVRVQVSQSSGEALLAVHNEGSTLSREQQQTIFQPFHRCQEHQSSHVAGWGLGLAICKEIVTLHNGRIWVESSPQTGTTFFVALPLSHP